MTGPVLLIDDDPDDAGMFEEVLKELQIHQRFIWFLDPARALDYLTDSPQAPFIIFCDVNMSKLNGIELKRTIDKNPELRKKSIPFIFYSTTVSHFTIDEAYTQLTIQGFFRKGNSYGEIKSMIKKIFDYWTLCQHPNSFA